MKVVLASKNPHKLVEISKITEKFGFELVLQSDLGVDIDVEETGTTFEENSFLKAEAVMKATGLPALADDSGICADALGGAPGIYSARFCGHHGDDEANNRLLLEKLKNEENKKAHYTCAIVLVYPDGKKISAEGYLYGEITENRAGKNGFGYDPYFYLPEYGCTTAELDPEIKNKISHRGNAIRALVEKLKNQ